MARLHYSTIMSLDGYMADVQGRFDWAMPSAEVHAFLNDLVRPIGTHLYGRRMYEVMVVWETLLEQPGLPAELVDFAQIWQGADKIVYSRTLEQAGSARTRIEREFDADAVRALKAEAPNDIAIGGAELAGVAIAAGLVDVYHCVVVPVLVGNGARALPDGVGVPLRLSAVRRFENGMVYLRYETGQ